MNPRGREAEPATLIVPDIASATPARSFRYSPRHLSLGQRISRIASVGMFAAAIHNPMIDPPPVFGQTGPDQSNEQVIDPNQFTDPMVAGVVAEAGADLPAENPSVDEEVSIEPETVLIAITPEPEPTPDTRPSSPWLPEIAEMLKSLPVVDGLRFVQVNPDIRNIVPCGQEGACYNSTTRTAYIEVGSPVGGMKHAQAHEACHAHQHRSILEAGLGEPNPNLFFWLETPEGKAFKAASDQVLRDHQRLGQALMPLPWRNFGENLIEDFANICPTWYIDFGGGIGNIGPQPLVDFAKQWLPKKPNQPAIHTPTASVTSRRP